MLRYEITNTNNIKWEWYLTGNREGTNSIKYVAKFILNIHCYIQGRQMLIPDKLLF